MSTGSLPRDSSDGQSKKSKRNKKKIANSDFLKNIFAQRSDLPKVGAIGWVTYDTSGVIRPICITILYHNLLLFIDIFHI
jgi:hypothetical protein